MHRRLIQLTLNARLPLFAGITAGVFAALCSVAQAYLVSTTSDQVFLHGAGLTEVWPALRLLLGVIAFRAGLLCLQELAASEVGIRIKSRLRGQLVAHILQLGPSLTDRQNTAELATAAVDGIEALDAYYAQYLPQLVISTLVPITVLLLVFPLDPLSGGILMLTAPLIPFFMYMIGRTAEQATSRQYSTLGRLSSHLMDSIQGLATLKIFGQSKAQIANIASVADRFRQVTLQVLRVSFLSAFALELLATMSTAIIAVEVALRLLYGRLEFQQALFLLLLAPEFYGPLRLLGARFHAGMQGTAAARHIFAVLDAPRPESTKRHICREQAHPQQQGNARTQGITFSAVSYSYPGRDRPALEDIDLHIAPGTHVAIVGPSGAGKTTLAALLLGFISPTVGAIQVGDPQRGPEAPSPPELRIGWVPQAPYIFHDTIEGNIRLGKPDASAEAVIQAARLAHLDGFVDSLPDGLQTVVGERGARLSSGEAQRLALARAFLLDTPILLLDEPSSSLDPENEALLDDSLARLAANRTVITIAHRLNTVERADEIIVLDAGRIIERGTHTELRAAGGLYSSLLAAGRGWQAPAGSDPYAAPSTAANAPVSATTTPHALEDPAPGGRAGGAFRRLLSFLRGSWGRIAVSVLLSTLTIGSSVALMGSAAWLISAAALHPSIGALQLAIVGVRFFGISRAVFRYLERLVSHDVTFRVLRNIRVWFYARLEPLAPARLMDFHAGDLVNRAIADVQTLENLYVRVLAPVMTALALGAAVWCYFWLSSARELGAVLAVGFGLTGFLVPLISMHSARRHGSRMITLRSQLRTRLVDSIQGLADILAFQRGKDWADDIDRIDAGYAKVQRSMARIGSLQAAASSVLMNLAMWSVLVLWIGRVTRNEGSGLLLAPFALIVLASFEAVAGLPQAGQLWPATVAAARRLFDIVSVPPAVTEEPAVMPPRSEPVSTYELEFRGVGFTYPGRTIPALEDFSLTIAKGESMAVVGPSGAGKSTLARLLLRFWDYGSGEILLQGQSIRAMTPDDCRARTGYTSQQPYLFDTSILENLRLARRGLQMADIERAAGQAQLDEFIESLPGGYDTLIGEHGARLSAGERQRLGIARVILKGAPLLVLDEPTANLDARTEEQVLVSLFSLARGKTCLFITHRLRRMDHFDRIVVLDHGRIREQGSHRNLLAAGGMYHRLWTLQNGRPEPVVDRLANAQ